MAVVVHRRPWTTRFILVCTGLLVVDFIIGVISFGHCTDAGDTCSTANEWADSLTFALGFILVGLIACGLVVEAIQRHQAARRDPDVR